MTPAEPELTVPGAIAAVAARLPERPAICQDGRATSYAELVRGYEAIAAHLGGDGGAVGVIADPGETAVRAILGVLRAGRVSVAVDPRRGDAELAALLDHAGASCALIGGADRDVGRPTVRLDAAAMAGPLPPGPTPASPAWIVYTSGTTGQPRGVVHSHRNLVHLGHKYGRALELGPDDRLTLLTSHHLGAATADLLSALLHGACLVPFPVRDRGLRALAEHVVDDGITVLHAVPTLVRQLLAAAGDRLRGSRLRVVRLGGETLTRADADALRRWLPPGCAVYNTLSATEIGGVCLYRLPPEPPDPVPVGAPMDGVAVRVWDASGAELPAGQEGEIVVTSRWLALGYHGLPELTARTFLPHPTDPSLRTYRTGDRGVMGADGVLAHVGRGDRQVKVRGHRVDLDHVEAVARGAPGVAAAAAWVVEAPDGLELRVVFSPAAAVDVRGHLARALPVTPARVWGVDALPLLASGKIDRRALAAPSPSSAPAADDPLEAWLTARWRELGLDVTPGLGFLSAGGDSLRGLALLASAAERTGHHAPLSVLADDPTPAALARRLREPASPLVALRPEGAGPPLFLVHGIDGEVLGLLPLARHLDHPVYALQPHGLADGEPDDVRRLAARYVREVRRICPHGPYHLAGYSAGGTLALEMAMQLLADGEAVAWLALIDDVAGHGRRPPRWWSPRWIAAFLGNLPGFVVDRATTLPPSRIAARALLTLRLALSWPLRRGAPEVDEIIDLAALPSGRREIARRVYRALCRYDAPIYPGRLVVLRASARKLRDPFLADNGWGAHARDGVELHTIRAGHELMCAREPFAGRVADALRRSLTRAGG